MFSLTVRRYGNEKRNGPDDRGGATGPTGYSTTAPAARENAYVYDIYPLRSILVLVGSEALWSRHGDRP